MPYMAIIGDILDWFSWIVPRGIVKYFKKETAELLVLLTRFSAAPKLPILSNVQQAIFLSVPKVA